MKTFVREHRNRLFLLLSCFALSCTEPIDLGIRFGSDRQLVVEGWVNDVDSTHVVRLSTSTATGVGENTLGRNAEVSITTGNGRKIQLTEAFPGRYETGIGELSGEVGQSYKLDILLENGSSYTSDEVTIPEPITILDTRTELFENRSQIDNGTPVVSYSHEVFVSLGNSNEDQFVLIESTGWAQLLVDYGLCEPVFGGPGIPGELKCWQFRDVIRSDINTVTNIGLSGDSYEVLAVSVPFDFRNPYVAELYVNSMSLEAFTYLESARAQLNRGGGVFDPPFAPLVGNISNLDDPTETVLGYFHAYAQSFTRVCFDRSGIPGQLNIPILDCFTTCEEFWAPAFFELPFGDEICPN